MKPITLTVLAFSLATPMLAAAAETLDQVYDRVEDRIVATSDAVAVDMMRKHECRFVIADRATEQKFEAEAIDMLAKRLEIETPLAEDVLGYLNSSMDDAFEELMETGALEVDQDRKVATLVKRCP